MNFTWFIVLQSFRHGHTNTLGRVDICGDDNDPTRSKTYKENKVVEVDNGVSMTKMKMTILKTIEF